MKYLPNVTIASTAKKYNTAEQTFRDWIKAGHRLLMLCAAGESDIFDSAGQGP
jgi:transposase-like protein